jgi:hypothetical protein
MDVFKILAELFEKPNAPKFYRELRNHYLAQGLTNEALALDYLLEIKFQKKDDKSSDSSHIS